MNQLILVLKCWGIKLPKRVCIKIVRVIPDEIFRHSRELTTHLPIRQQKIGALNAGNSRVADFLFHSFEQKVNFAAKHCDTPVVAKLLDKYTAGEIEMIMLTNRYLTCKNEINFHKLLGSAFAGGNPATVELIMFLGARIKDYALRGACRSGCLQYIQYVLERTKPDWPTAAVAACRGGHYHIVKIITQYGINNWNSCLCAASRSGSLKLVKYLVEKGATNYNAALALACRAGAVNVAQYLLDLGADNYKLAFEMSCRGGYLLFAKYFARKASVNWNAGLLLSLKTAHLPLIKYLLRRDVTNINDCFEIVCGLGNLNVVKAFVAYGADNIDNCIEIARSRGNYHVVNFLNKIKN